MVEWLKSDEPIEYLSAVEFMEERTKQISEGIKPELVWLLEHPTIYTAGISANAAEISADVTIPVFQTGRGGKYTYHGPGQRIIYIMLNLKKRNKCDVRLYIKNLSTWIINSLLHFSIYGEFKSDRIGVWINTNGKEEKIAAFGIKIRKWVTYHGVALNICPDLFHYSNIIPCGISEYGITSMKKLGIETSLNAVDEVLQKEFYRVFP
ncbi:MAG: octanoyltransferase [Candidatus Mesenet longicola]|uniref:Octanoyltransferase n=1 Tax=Candidatus Mesenet longicola TaxID=1892558 RepID=A0A8J3HVF8_9RICK|nr:MAG: octanoyltransferase [Candidatus Mesenet longicola]GHM59865.1 MAG: octanoyltransferase [Candidatus Mesenet longicola]